jgi:hypothetical protein
MKNAPVRQPLFMASSPYPLSSRKRTRISYFTALTGATYVVLLKENHMQLLEAAALDRKSGEAEGSAVLRTLLGNVFDRAYPDFLPRSTGHDHASATNFYRKSGVA